jgi:hypothetical protein
MINADTALPRASRLQGVGRRGRRTTLMKSQLLRRDDAERPDHFQVYHDADRVGTIYRAENVAAPNNWFWALNGEYKGPQPMSGWAASRDEAMTAVRAAWDRWGDQ